MISGLLTRLSPRRETAPVVTCLADRVCIRAPEIFSASAVATIHSFAQRVFGLGEVCQLDVDLQSGVGTIRFDRGVDVGSCLLRLAEQLRKARLPTTGDVPFAELVPGAEKLSIVRQREIVSSRQIVRQGDVPPGLPELAGGLRRVTYLFLAGASLGMAVVGVAVPGIPTVPFLLASSYFLVRSSPPLHQRLLDSRVFGPLLRDWHRHRAMRRSAKMFVLTTLVLVVVVSVTLADLTLPVAMIVAFLALIGVWMIWRIPTLDGSQAEAPAFNGEVTYLAMAQG